MPVTEAEQELLEERLRAQLAEEGEDPDAKDPEIVLTPEGRGSQAEGEDPEHPDEHEVHRWCRLVNENGGSCGLRDLRLRLPADAGGQLPLFFSLKATRPG